MDFLTLEDHWEHTLEKLKIKSHCEQSKTDTITFKTFFFLGAQSPMNLITNIFREREKGVKYTNVYDSVYKMIQEFDKESKEFFAEISEDPENGKDID